MCIVPYYELDVKLILVLVTRIDTGNTDFDSIPPCRREAKRGAEGEQGKDDGGWTMDEGGGAEGLFWRISMSLLYSLCRLNYKSISICVYTYGLL